MATSKDGGALRAGMATKWKVLLAVAAAVVLYFAIVFLFFWEPPVQR